jgi:hypothetical protein
MDNEVARINRRKGQPGEGWYEREITGQHAQPQAMQSYAHKYAEDDRTDVPLPEAKEKREKPRTELAEKWQGWHTALKPGWEVVLVFRKPIVEGSVTEQVITTSTGALNIDACRTAGGVNPTIALQREAAKSGVVADEPERLLGRWPMNVTLTHGPECKKTDSSWECQPGCPIATLDGQSGHTVSKARVNFSTAPSRFGYGDSSKGRVSFSPCDDEGGASRFYPHFEYEPGEIEDELAARTAAGMTEPVYLWQAGEFENGFHYYPKVSTSERNEGLPPGTENLHATVKPVALMRWLVRLVTPPGGIVLDPFCGSGTTGMAALWEHFRFVGCELEAKSAEVARRRCQYAAVKPKR